MMGAYRRIAQLKTAAQFRDYVVSLKIDLPFDDDMQVGPDAPLAQPAIVDGFTIGNRWCVLPMEGWDGTEGGFPTELTTRRWQRFGLSGAKLIWGGEAVAVSPAGRANPNQLMINEQTVGALHDLRMALVQTHEEHHATSDDLLVGLQLTHSGRFARPQAGRGLQPKIAYRHPLLDQKFGIHDDAAVLSDDELDQVVADFVRAAQLVHQAGYAFVDVKHCHGYLGHELLSAVHRSGKYGGSFENRTRFLREIVAGIRAEVPGLGIGVRLSAFDWIPFKPGADRTGVPETYDHEVYPYAFGSSSDGTGIDLAEPLQFLALLQSLDIRLVCITAGSPYYVPHIQRPALFPPSDGYQPPEDPLAGVARQIQAVAQLKQHCPDLFYVGSGYSYLQEWLPNVAQYVVRTGMADAVGIGRLTLSYPELPADVLAGKSLQQKRLCRTFSDCTTAPRNGLVSGCYPLDPFFKERAEFDQLAAFKKQSRS